MPKSSLVLSILFSLAIVLGASAQSTSEAGPRRESAEVEHPVAMVRRIMKSVVEHGYKENDDVTENGRKALDFYPIIYMIGDVPAETALKKFFSDIPELHAECFSFTFLDSENMAVDLSRGCGRTDGFLFRRIEGRWKVDNWHWEGNLRLQRKDLKSDL